MKDVNRQVFFLMLAAGFSFMALLPIKANVAEGPDWQRAGGMASVETCDFWNHLPGHHTAELATRLKNGLCAGEIWATFMLLDQEHQICPPTEQRPNRESLLLSDYVNKNQKEVAESSLFEVAQTAFKKIWPCPDLFRAK